FDEWVDSALWSRIAEGSGSGFRPPSFGPGCRLSHEHFVTGTREGAHAGDGLVLISVKHQNVHGCAATLVSGETIATFETGRKFCRVSSRTAAKLLTMFDQSYRAASFAAACSYCLRREGSRNSRMIALTNADA